MRYKLKDTVFPQNTSNVFCDVDNATLPFTKFQSKVKNYHMANYVTVNLSCNNFLLKIEDK